MCVGLSVCLITIDMPKTSRAIDITQHICLSVRLSVTLCISRNSSYICTKLYQWVAHKHTNRNLFHFFDSTYKMAVMTAMLNCVERLFGLLLWNQKWWRLRVHKLQLTMYMYMCPFENRKFTTTENGRNTNFITSSKTIRSQGNIINFVGAYGCAEWFYAIFVFLKYPKWPPWGHNCDFS